VVSGEIVASMACQMQAAVICVLFSYLGLLSGRSKTEGKRRDGGIFLEGKGCTRISENCKAQKETVSSFIKSNNCSSFYSNVDTITNKLQELKALINNDMLKS